MLSDFSIRECQGEWRYKRRAEGGNSTVAGGRGKERQLVNCCGHWGLEEEEVEEPLEFCVSVGRGELTEWLRRDPQYVCSLWGVIRPLWMHKRGIYGVE